MSDFDERWLCPGALVPVDIPTTGALIREIQRLRALQSDATPRGDTAKVDDLLKRMPVLVNHAGDDIYPPKICNWITDAADALRSNGGCTEKLREHAMPARNWGDKVVLVPLEVAEEAVRSAIERERLANMRADQAEEARDAALSATTAMPGEDAVLRVVYECFRSDADRKVLLRTVWKDGIDIEEPRHALKEFCAELLRLARTSGREGKDG